MKLIAQITLSLSLFFLVVIPVINTLLRLLVRLSE